MDGKLIEKAVEMAVRCHGEQKWGPFPYIVHLDKTARIFDSFFVRTGRRKGELAGEDTGVISCYLHDILEDTPCTKEEIGNTFTWLVADIVEALTDPKEGTREEKKEVVFTRLAQNSFVGEIGLEVKLCDRLANVRMAKFLGDKSRQGVYLKEHQRMIEFGFSDRNQSTRLLMDNILKELLSF